MKLLIAAINELVKDQHQSKIEALASRLKKQGGGVAGPSAEYFNSATANQKWTTISQEAFNLGLSAEYLAGLLLGSMSGMEAERAVEKVDLVWSGPNLGFVPVRRSEQVLVDLINSATETLHLLSFVLYSVPGVETAIEDALDKGVQVSMLIETEKSDGTDGFRKTATKLKENHPRMLIYHWPLSKRDNGGNFASMHGKCFLADGKRAFITSANLTSAALDRNIEIGVILEGGNVPFQVKQQFEAMVTTKTITLF
jgi:phosphatidylserine/phosphatidylglycerophosphate/cardiolipin synthase-like enzyme